MTCNNCGKEIKLYKYFDCNDSKCDLVWCSCECIASDDNKNDCCEDMFDAYIKEYL